MGLSSSRSCAVPNGGGNAPSHELGLWDLRACAQGLPTSLIQDVRQRMGFDTTQHRPRDMILILDEISAISADWFACIHHACLQVTGNQNEYFGGINVILAGDFFQFEPVGSSLVPTNLWTVPYNCEIVSILLS